MTAVAAFMLDGLPFVIGDLLITLDGGEEQFGLTLPSVGPVSSLGQRRPVLDGLQQKVVVVCPQLVVAFAANDARHAGVGLEALRRLAEKGAMTYESAVNLLTDRRVLQGVSFVGWFADHLESGATWFRPIQVRAQTVDDGGYVGRMSAAGTGIDYVRNASLRVHEDGYPLLPFGERQLAKAVALCGALFREEHATGSPIIDASFGGAYEVAHYVNGRFSKAELTFVVWDVDVSVSPPKICEPMLVVKSGYVKDTLHLNTALWQCEPDGSNQRAVMRVYGVDSAYRQQLSKVLPTPDDMGFQSPIFQHMIFIMTRFGPTLHSMVEVGSSKLNPMSVNGVFKFDRHQPLIDYLLEVGFSADKELGNEVEMVGLKERRLS